MPAGEVCADAGSAEKLQVLVIGDDPEDPDEWNIPGEGKGGAASVQTAGVAFIVRVNLTDAKWNIVTGDNTIVTVRNATDEEIERMKERQGVYEEGVDYNPHFNGHATGLRPPTEEEWDRIANDTLKIVDVRTPGALKTRASTSVDHSTSKYFPPIGTQDGEGSCVCWAVGYYTKTFQEAKEHDWDLSGCTWDDDTEPYTGYDGYPTTSYQDKIMTPDFIYHQINGGEDAGATYYDAMELVEGIGACSWEKMPYDRLDSTTWPDPDAWREAPYYRTDTGYTVIDLDPDVDPNGMTTLKNWIDAECRPMNGRAKADRLST